MLLSRFISSPNELVDETSDSTSSQISCDVSKCSLMFLAFLVLSLVSTQNTEQIMRSTIEMKMICIVEARNTQFIRAVDCLIAAKNSNTPVISNIIKIPRCITVAHIFRPTVYSGFSTVTLILLIAWRARCKVTMEKKINEEAKAIMMKDQAHQYLLANTNFFEYANLSKQSYSVRDLYEKMQRQEVVTIVMSQMITFTMPKICSWSFESGTEEVLAWIPMQYDHANNQISISCTAMQDRLILQIRKLLSVMYVSKRSIQVITDKVKIV